MDTNQIEFESWWERLKAGRPYLSTFEMHYVQGYGLAELSMMQGISQSAVKKRIRRARAFLLSVFGKQQPNGALEAQLKATANRAAKT